MERRGAGQPTVKMRAGSHSAICGDPEAGMLPDART